MATSRTQDPPLSALVERDLAAFWHPCGQMRDYEDFPPLEVVSARGTRFALADGREVLDAISSWWCKSLGHGHAGVRARVEAQLARFEHVITANTTNADLVELCERLLAMANDEPRTAWGPRDARATTRPSGFALSSPRAGAGGGARVAGTMPARHFAKVFLADNGSTAVEIALKMALQAQAQRGNAARTRFASLAGGYHGETIGALSVGDLGLYADPYRPLMFPVTKLGPVPYRSGPDAPAWLDAAAEWPAIEAALSPLAESLAAIVYEPVLQAAGQMRLFSPDLLTRLRRWADEHGVYLIADEIAAGFGRLGEMLASHLAPRDDARGGAAPLPDFVLLSKGLTAGFLPLSAVLTTDDVFATFYGDWSTGRAFLHSNTYTGNALGVAAALGALDAYAAEGVLENVSVVGAHLRAGLAAVASASPALSGVRGCGMVAAVDLVAPGGAPLDAAARTGRRVFREAVRRGALLRPIGDTLYLFPPLNASASEIDVMLSILADSVGAVTA